MFFVVVGTAIALRPPLGDVLRGLVVPSIPELNDGGLEHAGSVVLPLEFE